jgi:hypothetical protein
MKNIDIAHTHRLYRKFVGHTVALSGLLAFIVNALSVMSGIIVIAMTSIAGSPLGTQIIVAIVSGIIGLLLAVLADGMTLSSCARLRIAQEKIELIKENYSQIPDNEKANAVRSLERQELKPHEKSSRVSVISILFFVAISCAAGTLFWHKLLESLPVWQAWLFSTLFSLLVSVTLIACELYKRTNNEIVREAIVADHFTNEALLEDANERALELLHGKYKVEIEQIAQNTGTIKYAIEEHAVSVYDNLLAGGKGLIPARIHREKADKDLQFRNEQEQVRQQLQLIKGGRDEHPVRSIERPATTEEQRVTADEQSVNTGPIGVPEVQMTTEQRVRMARLNNPNMSIRNLAEMLNVSVSTVHKYSREVNGSEGA